MLRANDKAGVRSRVFHLVVLGALAAATGPGCASEVRGPTVFEFEGMTPRDADAMERTLRERGLVLTRRDSSSGTRFETTSVTSSRQYGSILKSLQKTAERERIEMNFEGVAIRYSSLTAVGSALTTITIEASPGARAWIADRPGRDPWRAVRLDQSGRWRGAVQTAGRVSEAGGWLFIAFTRDGRLFRYARVNVLTNEQQPATFAQIKSAGLSEPIARRDEPETPSQSGAAAGAAPAPEEKKEEPKTRWKWPWQ